MQAPHTDELVEIVKEMKSISEYDPEYPLISSGFFDSFDIMTLVARVEERYNIKIPGEEITPENLDTCAAIGAMIERLQDG